MFINCSKLEINFIKEFIIEKTNGKSKICI